MIQWRTDFGTLISTSNITPPKGSWVRRGVPAEPYSTRLTEDGSPYLQTQQTASSSVVAGGADPGVLHRLWPIQSPGSTPPATTGRDRSLILTSSFGIKTLDTDLSLPNKRTKTIRSAERSNGFNAAQGVPAEPYSTRLTGDGSPYLQTQQTASSSVVAGGADPGVLHRLWQFQSPGSAPPATTGRDRSLILISSFGIKVLHTDLSLPSKRMKTIRSAERSNGFKIGQGVPAGPYSTRLTGDGSPYLQTRQTASSSVVAGGADPGALHRFGQFQSPGSTPPATTGGDRSLIHRLTRE